MTFEKLKRPVTSGGFPGEEYLISAQDDISVISVNLRFFFDETPVGSGSSTRLLGGRTLLVDAQSVNVELVFFKKRGNFVKY